MFAIYVIMCSNTFRNQLVRQLCIRFLVLVTTLLLFSTRSFALAPCDTSVVDAAGVLRDIPSIQTAVAKLEELGAKVWVRVSSNSGPDANLDSYAAGVRDTVCPRVWAASSGTWRSNAVVFWVSMDRKVGLYYGQQWPGLIGSTVRNDIINGMKPILKTGDIDGAFVKAINDVTTIITNSRRQPDPIISSSAVEAVKPVIIQREPTDWSPFAWVFGIGLVLSVLIIGGRRGYAVYALHADRDGKRRGKQQEAINAFGTVLPLLEAIDSALKGLKGRLDAVAPETSWVSSSTSAGWQTAHKRLETAVGEVGGRFNALTDPNGEDGTIEEYEAVLVATKDMLRVLQELKTQLTALDDTIIRTEAQYREFPALKTRVMSIAAAVSARITIVQKAGFTVDVMTAAVADKAIEEALHRADVAYEQRDYDGATKLLEGFIEQMEKAANDAEAISRRKAELLVRLHDAEARLQKLQGRYPEAETVRAHLKEHFAAQCSEGVSGNRARAEALLKKVPEACRTIIRKLDGQQWEDAEADLQQVVGALSAEEDLLAAIFETKTRLEETFKDASTELVEAERSIVAARGYLSHTKEGVDPSDHRRPLKEAELLAAEARRILGQTQPDVIAAFDAATKADELADKVLEAAGEQYEQAKRKRERAEKAVAEAERQLAAADSYYRTNRHTIGSTTRRKLEAAERRRAELATAKDHETIILIASSIRDEATSSLSSAKVEVREARTSDTGGSSDWGSSPVSTPVDTGGSSSW